jgi:hypothetical protein
MPRVWLACLCVGRRLPAFNSWDLDEAGSRNNFPGTQRQRPCARAAAHVAVPAAARAVRRVGRRPAGGEARRGKRAARAGACLPAGPGASSVVTHSLPGVAKRRKGGVMWAPVHPIIVSFQTDASRTMDRPSTKGEEILSVAASGDWGE